MSLRGSSLKVQDCVYLWSVAYLQNFAKRQLYEFIAPLKEAQAELWSETDRLEDLKGCSWSLCATIPSMMVSLEFTLM